MFKSSIRAMAVAGAAAIAIGTIFASNAEAHNRHRGHRHRTVVVTPWFSFWQRPIQPRVRISDHCVYKPWTNRTVCRY